jgi:hypothetical protein
MASLTDRSSPNPSRLPLDKLVDNSTMHLLEHGLLHLESVETESSITENNATEEHAVTLTALLLLHQLTLSAELLLENATFPRCALDHLLIAPSMLLSPKPLHVDPTLEFAMFN